MIFIAGPHGAGKTCITRLLCQHGFSSIDLGPCLRDMWRREATGFTFDEYIRRNEELYGKHFTDQALSTEINRLLQESSTRIDVLDLLVTGNRTIDGIHYIKDHCLDMRRKTIFYIDADEQVLFMRYCAREGRKLTLEEFQKILEKDCVMGLEAIKADANFVILNNGTLEDFQNRVFSVIFNELGYKYQTIEGMQERRL